MRYVDSLTLGLALGQLSLLEHLTVLITLTSVITSVI